MANAGTASLPRVLIAAGGIYTAQSLIGGLTFMGIPAILRAENVALDKIGLVSLAMLVWAVKFLWSPWTERLRILPDGRRRSRLIIVAGEIVVALLLIGLGFAGTASFTTILVLLVLMAVASATVDIACDAYIIEQMQPGRRGAGNVAQVGGGYLGLIFGSGLFVTVSALWGWLVACMLLALILLAMSLPMALTPEARRKTLPQTERPGLKSALCRFDMRMGLCMAVVFEMSGRLAQSLSGPFLIDAGIPLSLLGVLNGIGGVVAGVAGAALGGLIVHRHGAKAALLLVAMLHVATLCLVAAIVTLHVQYLPMLIGAFMLEGAIMAAGFVAIYSRLMDIVSEKQPGVDFTLFQSASAVAAALFGYSGAMLAARSGYSASFLMALLLALMTPFLIRFLERRLIMGISS
ncbi:MFS transporter [Brucella pseudogrignonensis]|uniref:MFS transporter n=1 Tax=Brucella pseudogrignonensis TaxID=419475 RepID=UPI0038B5C28B